MPAPEKPEESGSRALIGEGGMGQIWEAEQLSSRRVAVKFVRPERVTVLRPACPFVPRRA